MREVAELIARRQSVHVRITDDGTTQDAVRKQLLAHAPELAVIDFENPVTYFRPQLLGEIVRVLGVRGTIPDQKPQDFAEFGRHMAALRGPRALAIIHFDLIASGNRLQEYETDLFHTLRYYTMTDKKLVLVLVGRKPFGDLLPLNHPLSGIDLKVIELGGLS